MPAKKITKKAAKKTPSKKVVKKTVKKVVPKKKSAKKRVTKTVIKKKTVAKKVVRKAIAKKTVAKKSVCVTCSTQCDAPEAFWVHNGPILHTLEELLKALQVMTDAQYAHHTARGGNDFANWIKDCLGDEACATSLRRAKTRTGAVKVLSNRCC